MEREFLQLRNNLVNSEEPVLFQKESKIQMKKNTTDLSTGKYCNWYYIFLSSHQFALLWRTCLLAAPASQTSNLCICMEACT